jgi:hypothetical protein
MQKQQKEPQKEKRRSLQKKVRIGCFSPLQALINSESIDETIHCLSGCPLIGPKDVQTSPETSK